MFIKIINRKILIPPKNVGNQFNADRDQEWLAKNGFFEVNDDEMEDYILDLVSPIQLYSRDKLISLLGNNLKDYIPLLVKENLLTQFFTTDCFTARNRKYAEFRVKINADHPGLLEQCIVKR